MGVLIIKKDGFFDDEDNRVEDLAHYLKAETILDGIITLENLFDSLFSYKGIEVLFKGWTLGVNIFQYYQEMKQKDADTDLNYLTISKNGQLWNFDGVREIDEIYHFSGRKDDVEIGYALDFTPIYTIKELEIRLDNTYIVYDEDNNEVINAQRRFTLDEIVGTILFDITFHGDIDRRDSVSASLDETAKRIDNGEEELFTMEEVKAQIFGESLEELLEKALEEEDYERAAELREEIKESKNGKNK